MSRSDERLEAEIARLRDRAAEVEQRLAESQCELESAREQLAEFRRRPSSGSSNPLRYVLAAEVRLLDMLEARHGGKEASGDGK